MFLIIVSLHLYWLTNLSPTPSPTSLAIAVSCIVWQSVMNFITLCQCIPWPYWEVWHPKAPHYYASCKILFLLFCESHSMVLIQLTSPFNQTIVLALLINESTFITKMWPAICKGTINFDKISISVKSKRSIKSNFHQICVFESIRKLKL